MQNARSHHVGYNGSFTSIRLIDRHQCPTVIQKALPLRTSQNLTVIFRVHAIIKDQMIGWDGRTYSQAGLLPELESTNISYDFWIELICPIMVWFVTLRWNSLTSFFKHANTALLYGFDSTFLLWISRFTSFSLSRSSTSWRIHFLNSRSRVSVSDQRRTQHNRASHFPFTQAAATRLRQNDPLTYTLQRNRRMTSSYCSGKK